jgi:hypothetical protein
MIVPRRTWEDLYWAFKVFVSRLLMGRVFLVAVLVVKAFSCGHRRERVSSSVRDEVVWFRVVLFFKV